MWQRIWALIVKEFLSLLKDNKSRTVIIIPPLVQLIVFGYAASYDLKHIPYAVYNEDSGRASRDLLAGFEGSDAFRRVEEIEYQDQIASAIDSHHALIVIHIESQFTRHLLSSQTATVQVIIDGRNSNTALLVLNYARSIINTFNLQWIEKRRSARPPTLLQTRVWFNPNLESRWFFVPGIVGLLTLVVTIMVTGLAVAREREQGTWDQMLVTPYRPIEILIGKALPGFVIGIAEATLIVTLAVLWFDIPLRGELMTLYVGLTLFLLSAIGVGLMISSLSVTMQQALLGAFLFLVPAVILSGFATPIANMPKLVQHITLLNPMRYFMTVVRGVFLEGNNFHQLLPQFWPMMVIGLLSLMLAAWLFRNRMY